MLTTRAGETPEELIDQIAWLTGEINRIDIEIQTLSVEVESISVRFTADLVDEIRENASGGWNGIMAGDLIVQYIVRERLYSDEGWLRTNERYVELQNQRRDLGTQVELARWELMTLVIRSTASMLVPLDLLLASGQPS
jgi:hypothetical protein